MLSVGWPEEHLAVKILLQQSSRFPRRCLLEHQLTRVSVEMEIGAVACIVNVLLKEADDTTAKPNERMLPAGAGIGAKLSSLTNGVDSPRNDRRYGIPVSVLHYTCRVKSDHSLQSRRSVILVIVSSECLS